MKSRRYWRASSLYYTISVVFVISLVFYLLRISSVECNLNNKPCPQEINQSLSYLSNTSLITLSRKKILKKVGDILPVKKVDIHFKLLNKLSLDIETLPENLSVNLFLIPSYPDLTMSRSPESSTSSVLFKKPSEEIKELSSKNTTVSYSLWSDGSLTPVATNDAKVNILITQKPEGAYLSQIYRLVQILSKYLEYEAIFAVNEDVFLSRKEQPDIITAASFEERSLLEALQSLGFLSTIKLDSKIIDLRYKNPVIR